MNEDWEIVLSRIAGVMYNTRTSDQWEDIDGVEKDIWLRTAAAGIDEMEAIVKERKSKNVKEKELYLKLKKKYENDKREEWVRDEGDYHDGV